MVSLKAFSAYFVSMYLQLRSGIGSLFKLSPKKDRHKELLGFVVDLVLAIVFGVVSMPVFVKWLGWTACWCLFVFLILHAVNPLYRLPATTRIVVAVVVIFVFCLFFSGVAISQWKEEKAAMVTGVITPYDDGADHTGRSINYQLGITRGAVFEFPGNKGEIDLKYDKLILTRDKDGKLELSVTIRDEQQRLIVEIINNHWRVTRDTTLCWDKNYTDHALEVKDGRGRVLLQVILEPDTLIFQIEWLPEGIVMIGRDKVDYTKEEGIKPIFRYPSSEHWGELLINP